MSSSIQIKPVSSPEDVREFIRLPYRIYRKDPWWVPPLESDIKELLDPVKNVQLQKGEHQFLLAGNSGEIKARLGVGIDGEINRAKGKKEGYITLFEGMPDYDIFKSLLDYASDWLRRRGMRSMVGPISPTRGDDYRGMLVKGFGSSPVLMNPYNPVYYVDYFEEYGFEKDIDFCAYYYDLNREVPSGMVRGVELARRRYGFAVHSLKLQKMDSELRDIKRIVDEAMPEEWTYLVPPELSELRVMADKLLKLAEPSLVSIARVGERPIGFALAMPDYNQVLKRVKGRLFPTGFLNFLRYRKSISGARFFIMFVVPDYHKKGVSAAIYLKTFQAARKLGYTYGEGSQIEEDNLPMRRDAEGVGGRLYKKYRIFRKEL